MDSRPKVRLPPFLVGFVISLIVFLFVTVGKRGGDGSDRGVKPPPHPTVELTTKTAFGKGMHERRTPASTTSADLGELVHFHHAVLTKQKSNSLSLHETLASTLPCGQMKESKQYLASERLYLFTGDGGCSESPAAATMRETVRDKAKCDILVLPTDNSRMLLQLNPFSRGAISVAGSATGHGNACTITGSAPLLAEFASYHAAKISAEDIGWCDTQRGTGAEDAAVPYRRNDSYFSYRQLGCVDGVAPTATIEPLCIVPQRRSLEAVAPERSRILVGGIDPKCFSGDRSECHRRRFLFDIGTHGYWNGEADESDLGLIGGDGREMGASGGETNPRVKSLHWLHSTYSAPEINLAFTEVSSWRPSWKLLPAIRFFQGIPPYLKPAYHYFNYPPTIVDVPPSVPIPYTLLSSNNGHNHKETSVDDACSQGRRHYGSSSSAERPPATNNDNPLNHIRARVAPSDYLVLAIDYSRWQGLGDEDAAAMRREGRSGIPLPNASLGLEWTSRWLQQIIDSADARHSRNRGEHADRGGETFGHPLAHLVDEVFVSIGDFEQQPHIQRPSLTVVQKEIVRQLQRLREMGIRAHLWA